MVLDEWRDVDRGRPVRGGGAAPAGGVTAAGGVGTTPAPRGSPTRGGGAPREPRGAAGAGQGRAQARAPAGARRLRPASRPRPTRWISSPSRTSRAWPTVVPVRWGRMAQSPFGWLRGLAGGDGRRPRRHARPPRSTVQLCGDAHLLNFGLFAAPDRRQVFDVNDFDETLRRAVRVGREAVGGQRCRGGAGMAGFADDVAARAVADAVSAYRTRMAGYAEHAGARRLVRDDRRRRGDRDGPARASRDDRARAARARSRTSLSVLPKLAEQTPARSPHPRPAAARAAAVRRPSRRARRRSRRALPGVGGRRDAAAGRPVPARRPGAQGRRRRLGRHPVLRRAARGRGRRRPAVPADQGGPAVGAGAAPRPEPVCVQRRAGGAGPADDAGGRRHAARLVRGRRIARTTCASCGT